MAVISRNKLKQFNFELRYVLSSYYLNDFSDYKVFT